MGLLLIPLFFLYDARAHLQAWNIALEWFNIIASYLGNPVFNFGSSVPVLKFFWLFLPHPSRFILHWHPTRFTVTSAVETLTASKLRHHTRTRWNFYFCVTARVCFKTKPSEEVGFDRVPVVEVHNYARIGVGLRWPWRHALPGPKGSCGD